MDSATKRPRPMGRAALWLLGLAVFFFVSYNAANNYASQLADVGSVVFDWERHIPFLAWTIFPYWLIDILYGISLFMCVNKAELDSHGKRLLTAQIIAVSCFMLFPLTFTFARPEVAGLPGLLFDALSDFDKPFNQAPSLHITLLVILWVLYARRLPSRWLWLVHGTGALIGISVLTTYQHHFIDIPTGLLLGWFCIWLWPEHSVSPLKQFSLTRVASRWRIGVYYIFTSCVLASLAIIINGAALWLLWPAVSCLLIAIFYIAVGQAGFQKRADGRMSLAASWLLWPYSLAAKLNAYLWTRKDSHADLIIDNVYIGRFPRCLDSRLDAYAAVIDMTAEFSRPYHHAAWHAFPSLDLATPEAKTLQQAATKIQNQQPHGAVLVCCALGYSRSVLAVMAWLLMTKRASHLEDVIAIIKRARPMFVIKPEDRRLLTSLFDPSANVD